MQTLTPRIFVINGLSGLVLKVLGIRDAGHQTITEKELRTYVNVSHEDGVIKSEEKDMINNVFDFGDALAKDIMIPRIDMTCVSTDATLEEVMRIFREEMYTRLPVYEDHPDNMIGMLNIKDMLFVEANQPFHVKDHLRDAYYTYEFKKTANLMMEMREKTVNVAFVLSEYGACAGMITMEDLLEEIVGEIRDEYDSDEEGLINQVGEGKYLIEGTMKLDDVNDALHTSLSSEDYDTIGGLMIGHLDRLPQNRESITLADGTILTCRGLRQHRIIKVLLELPATPNENPSGTFTSK
ncbi:MAG: HlyC/CorC family transporter, partial [Lachnospiraceae bacterium]|nr:HlyC/CorC family transporter [Lachnospiraceae bacterium]